MTNSRNADARTGRRKTPPRVPTTGGQAGSSAEGDSSASVPIFLADAPRQARTVDAWKRFAHELANALLDVFDLRERLGRALDALVAALRTHFLLPELARAVEGERQLQPERDREVRHLALVDPVRGHQGADEGPLRGRLHPLRRGAARRDRRHPRTAAGRPLPLREPPDRVGRGRGRRHRRRRLRRGQRRRGELHHHEGRAGADRVPAGGHARPPDRARLGRPGGDLRPDHRGPHGPARSPPGAAHSRCGSRSS